MSQTLQQARLLNSRKSGFTELQKSYGKFGGGTNGGTERRDGALKAESRSPDFYITRLLASLEPFLAALPSFSSRGTSQILQASPIFSDCKNTYSILLGSPNLIFLQIRFIIILQKMRSRKLKRLSEPKNFYSRQLVKISLSKVDFSKFLCYNIYRKMRKKKVISQKLSQVYQKIIDNQP